MPPPDAKHYALRQQLRLAALGRASMPVLTFDLVALLDYIDELERDNYRTWEAHMAQRRHRAGKL
jgi:hypothetical protein